MERLELDPAQIVVPPLQVRRAYGPSHDAFEQGDVFVEDLILKSLGARGYQNTPAMDQRGQEVRQRLSSPGARLDDDVVLTFKGFVHGFRHPYLRWPELVIRQALLQNSPRPEKLIHHLHSVYRGGAGRGVCSLFKSLIANGHQSLGQEGNTLGPPVT